MTDFKLYTPDNAPEASKPLLAAAQKKYGFVPNIYAHMAESPIPVKVYDYAQGLLNSEGTLTPEEVNLAQLAISAYNGCEFCVPAHSTVGKNMLKTDPAIINAIREGGEGPNPKINALVRFTQALAEKRGSVNDSDLESFLKAGYTKAQVFEILTIIAYKTLTNYTSNFAGTKPNEQFAAEKWQAPAKRGSLAA